MADAAQRMISTIRTRLGNSRTPSGVKFFFDVMYVSCFLSLFIPRPLLTECPLSRARSFSPPPLAITAEGSVVSRDELGSPRSSVAGDEKLHFV